LARVVREKSKVLSGTIGINTTGGADVSSSLNQIASAANNASQMFFTRANEIAQEEGIQAGKDLTIDQITTLDENTGKPVALSIPKTWGITRTKAFRELVDKRFYASIENEIRLKSKEYSQKYKRGGNYLANYRASMENYLVQMHKNSEGAYANFIKEVGSNTIAATEPNILSYLESKHIAQTESFYKIEVQKYKNAYATANPEQRTFIQNKLKELTQNMVDAGLAPKNAQDSIRFDLGRINALQGFSAIIQKLDKQKLEIVNDYLAAPYNEKLIDKLGLSEDDKKFFKDQKRYLGLSELNSLRSYTNQEITDRNQLEAEQNKTAYENILNNETAIVETIQSEINKITSVDLDNLDSQTNVLIDKLKEQYPDFNLNTPQISNIISKYRNSIESSLISKSIIPIIGGLDDDEERLFQERKGMDLITNQSFINNYTTLSQADQNKYDSIIEAVPKAKEIFDTLHELSQRGIAPKSIVQSFKDLSSNWTKELTQAQKNLNLKKANFLDPTYDQAFTSNNSNRTLANDIAQELWQQDKGQEAFKMSWINDPNVFNNERVMQFYNLSLSRGIVPQALVDAVKSNNVSETAHRLLFSAQNFQTSTASGVPITQNILNNVEGLKSYNQKLSAVMSAIRLGITSPMATLSNPTDQDIASGRVDEGTGLSLLNISEGFEKIRSFTDNDPNSELSELLNRQAKRMEFKNYATLRQEIFNELSDENPALLRDFNNITDYMLMVGTQFDKKSLKIMIEDYLALNTRADGIVVDSLNFKAGGKSIYALELVAGSGEMAFAMANSLEQYINNEFKEAGLTNLFHFNFDKDSITEDEANNIFFSNRVDFDAGLLNDLGDDRVIVRAITEGGQKAETIRLNNGILSKMPTFTLGPIGGNVAGEDFYYKAVPETTVYDPTPTFTSNRTGQKLYLVPLPQSLRGELDTEESYFDLQYMVAIQSSGGGLQPLVNPNNRSVFTFNPKVFSDAIESYQSAVASASLNEAEKNAYELNRINANNPEWQRKIGVPEKITDKGIIFGIDTFNFINKQIQEVMTHSMNMQKNTVSMKAK
jgi:hypothetical protein